MSKEPPRQRQRKRKLSSKAWVWEISRKGAKGTTSVLKSNLIVLVNGGIKDDFQV